MAARGNFYIRNVPEGYVNTMSLQYNRLDMNEAQNNTFEQKLTIF